MSEQTRIVTVFPGSSQAFIATEIANDGRKASVMTPAEEVLHVWADQVRAATAAEVAARFNPKGTPNV